MQAGRAFVGLNDPSDPGKGTWLSRLLPTRRGLWSGLILVAVVVCMN